MAQENVVFQQRTNARGEMEFRTKFGRQKAIVFRKHLESGFFMWIFMTIDRGDQIE